MADADKSGQEKVQNPRVEDIVTALVERVNRIQIDFVQMCKLHTESITRLDDLAKKVEAKLPDPVVQPHNSGQQPHNANPTGGLGGGVGQDPPIQELSSPVRNAMEEEHLGNPFPRPPRRVPGLRTVPGDISGLELPYIEGLPDRVLRQALEGQYIQIDLFLENPTYDIESDSALEVVTGEEGLMTCRQKRPRRGVYNVISWLEAYENYMRVMVNYHGVTLFNNMSAYKTTIVEYDRMYLWKAVQRFDMKHRGRLGGKSIDFQSIDILLCNRILNSSVLKLEATRCTICGAYEHIYASCPFRDTPGTQSRSVGHRNNIQPARPTNERCFNWNANRCHDAQCWRLHICRGCGGNMPYKQCCEDGPCAGNTNRAGSYHQTTNQRHHMPPNSYTQTRH